MKQFGVTSTAHGAGKRRVGSSGSLGYVRCDLPTKNDMADLHNPVKKSA
jgi:hypothetical protein